jgi:hypothetical protein
MPVLTGVSMQHVTLKLTVEELRLLATLASDQLFRREFIDPNMPGYKTNVAEMKLGKALVERLRLLTDGPRKVATKTKAVAV